MSKGDIVLHRTKHAAVVGRVVKFWTHSNNQDIHPQSHSWLIEFEGLEDLDGSIFKRWIPWQDLQVIGHEAR